MDGKFNYKIILNKSTQSCLLSVYMHINEHFNESVLNCVTYLMTKTTLK